MKKWIAAALTATALAVGFAWLYFDTIGTWAQLRASCSAGCVVGPSPDGGIYWVRLDAVQFQCPGEASPQTRRF